MSIATSPVEVTRAWQRRAMDVMPGGVNSPVRAFRAVGGAPVFVASGNGARLRTVEGDEPI
ncbi:MAG TPA: aspartate aminotransferase family protein, partial [Acidimicrobiia bacterium]|nr:aspartate aminotransferase family protein [Acidimicrobiia bacterium]